MFITALLWLPVRYQRSVFHSLEGRIILKALPQFSHIKTNETYLNVNRLLKPLFMPFSCLCSWHFPDIHIIPLHANLSTQRTIVSTGYMYFQYAVIWKLHHFSRDYIWIAFHFSNTLFQMYGILHDVHQIHVRKNAFYTSIRKERKRTKECLSRAKPNKKTEKRVCHWTEYSGSILQIRSIRTISCAHPVERQIILLCPWQNMPESDTVFHWNWLIASQASSWHQQPDIELFFSTVLYEGTGFIFMTFFSGVMCWQKHFLITLNHAVIYIFLFCLVL